MVLLMVFGSAASFVPHYWTHVFIRLISGMAAAGLFTSGFILGNYTSTSASKFVCNVREYSRANDINIELHITH